MHCWVYKGDRKQGYYLFLGEALQDGVAPELPQALSSLLGKLSLVTEVELKDDSRLAQSDVQFVLESIHTQGYYLQMPRLEKKTSIH